MPGEMYVIPEEPNKEVNARSSQPELSEERSSVLYSNDVVLGVCSETCPSGVIEIDDNRDVVRKT